MAHASLKPAEVSHPFDSAQGRLSAISDLLRFDSILGASSVRQTEGNLRNADRIGSHSLKRAEGGARHLELRREKSHGSAGNGAAKIMRHLYGENGHSITWTNPAVPTITLQSTSFDQITDDISDARVFGRDAFSNRPDRRRALGKGSRENCI